MKHKYNLMEGSGKENEKESKKNYVKKKRKRTDILDALSNVGGANPSNCCVLLVFPENSENYENYSNLFKKPFLQFSATKWC